MAMKFIELLLYLSDRNKCMRPVSLTHSSSVMLLITYSSFSDFKRLCDSHASATIFLLILEEFKILQRLDNSRNNSGWPIQDKSNQLQPRRIFQNYSATHSI